MRAGTSDSGEWVDGFLFVGNRLILDFLNTKPVLPQGPTELLRDVPALQRWLIASGMMRPVKARRLMRNWRNSSHATSFLKELLAFRERLRSAVLRMEGGLAASDEFIQEVNAGLVLYRPTTALHKREGRIVRELSFDPKVPTDLWAPLLNGAADLLAEPEPGRIRKCEACVVHFFDTSKKGARRWCSMNICGNKLKVAAYQRRQRDRALRG